MNRRGITKWIAPLFLSTIFVGCDDCKTKQAETQCWSHAGSASSSCKVSRDTEPNGTVPTAQPATIDCSRRTLLGTLGSYDVDVFKASGNLCEDSLPQASWEMNEGRLCMFAGCAHGLMNFAGCKSGTPERFREGILGCCVGGKGSVVLDAHCSPLEKSVQVWIVADGGDVGGCQDYEIAYSN